MANCKYCDGPHNTENHKSLGQLQVESAYTNIQLPKEEQTDTHFRGYYPKNDYICKNLDAATTIAHHALKSLQEVVNCQDCKDVANKELEIYRERCYCTKCVKKRKES